MFIPPPRPGDKPSKAAEYVAMVIGACMIVLFFGFLVNPIPTRESLAAFDASDVPLVLDGKDIYTLMIAASADTQLRHMNLQRDAVDELRTLLAAGRHRITVLSVPNNLWVLPEAMERGLRRPLFTHPENTARAGGAKLLKVTADPHAEDFYRKMGLVTMGREPAAMGGPDRFHSLMKKRLQA